jgi:L-lactate dehydrogenase (cytochrome)
MGNAFLTVEDFRHKARRRLPRVAFDFVDGGAESEGSERANLAAFDDVKLRPRNGTRVGLPDLRTTVLGQELSMPIALAPCGMARIVDPLGDLAAVRAAGAAGTAFTLSTMSGHRLEAIAEAATGPIWFQVYDVGGRARVEHTLDRASTAGFGAIMVTLDTQVSGGRWRDARNGTAVLLGPNKLAAARYVPPLIRKPRWLARRMLDGLVPRVENVLLDDGRPEYLWKDIRPRTLAWEDFAWLRECWKGQVMVKGVLTAEDARRALDVGVDAIVVSNHGGRQLDGVHATLEVLPEIVNAVAGRCEVLLDGGIRRGNDVVKALSLGAKAVLIGRPWMYALGGAGEPGVTRLLEIFRRDLERDLQLMGCAKVSELGRDCVDAPGSWFTRPDMEFTQR